MFEVSASFISKVSLNVQSTAPSVSDPRITILMEHIQIKNSKQSYKIPGAVYDHGKLNQVQATKELLATVR